jgi:hypothetical protein
VIATILFLGLIAYLIVARIKLRLEAYLGLLWLISIWGMTYVSHLATGFVASDEVYFSTQTVERIFSNRALWILLNQANALFTDNVIQAMRVLNLFFLCLLYITAVRSFRALSPQLLAVCMSYYACIAALNLRDVALQVGMLMFLAARGNAGHGIRDQFRVLYKTKYTVAFLFLLRPFQVLLLFLSGFRLHILALCVLIGIAFLQSPVGTRYFYNMAFYTQNFSEAISEKAELKEVSDVRPSPLNVAYWMARFVFAPSPPSIAHRLMFEPETYPYGQVDLTFRVVNRFVLYGLMLAILLHVIEAPRLVLGVMRDNSYVLKFGFLFTLVYALFNFGASHERIKVTILLLAIFLLDRIRCARRSYS